MEYKFNNSNFKIFFKKSFYRLPILHFLRRHASWRDSVKVRREVNWRFQAEEGEVVVEGVDVVAAVGDDPGWGERKVFLQKKIVLQYMLL